MAFTLELPAKEEIKKAVEAETAVDTATSLMISDASKEKGDEILRTDIDNFKDRQELTKAIEEFGTDIIKKSADKNSIMTTRIGDLSKAGGESGAVAKGLEELSRQMEDLDPSAVDFLKKGPLGNLFNPVRSYFNKFKAADSVIGEIMESLEKGARTLRDDNTTLELEQAAMRDLTKQLNQKIVLGQELDDYLTEQINHQRAVNGDSEKIKFIEEEILFPLIRSVNRAQTVTIAALNVAVTVAGALYNQKLVLEKVKILNQTTNNMIASTSRMLNTQGTEIQKQAMDSNIQVETLKEAFKETLGALDSINQYKQKALPQMKETIAQFKQLAQEGETVIQNIEESEIMRGRASFK